MKIVVTKPKDGKVTVVLDGTRDRSRKRVRLEEVDITDAPQLLKIELDDWESRRSTQDAVT